MEKGTNRTLIYRNARALCLVLGKNFLSALRSENLPSSHPVAPGPIKKCRRMRTGRGAIQSDGQILRSRGLRLPLPARAGTGSGRGVIASHLMALCPISNDNDSQIAHHFESHPTRRPPLQKYKKLPNEPN